MYVVNLTPHGVNVEMKNGSWAHFPPSGQVARVGTTLTAVEIDSYPAAVQELGRHYGAPVGAEIAIRTSQFGEVVGLPESEEGTVFIVSALVRQAVPSRLDVLSPGEPIRNDAGQTIGCDGFTVNSVNL